MEKNDGPDRGELLANTAEIIKAYAANNAVTGTELPALIQTVFDRVSALEVGSSEPVAAPTPAVPIRRSIADDHIVCLEDGQKLKMLKRHLMSDHGMTPEEYRRKWGLAHDYPMVAPAYALKRKELAIKIGLGRKPAPSPEPVKPKRRRKAAA